MDEERRRFRVVCRDAVSDEYEDMDVRADSFHIAVAKAVKRFCHLGPRTAIQITVRETT